MTVGAAKKHQSCQFLASSREIRCCLDPGSNLSTVALTRRKFGVGRIPPELLLPKWYGRTADGELEFRSCHVESRQGNPELRKQRSGKAILVGLVDSSSLSGFELAEFLAFGLSDVQLGAALPYRIPPF